METHLFDYDLPESLIAQVPAPKRDASKLMVVDRKTQKVQHLHFRDICDVLPQDAVLFRNNATVLKARLRGTRDTGGAVECLLLNPGKTASEFWCLLKPGKRLPPGSSFSLSNGTRAHVIDKNTTGEYLIGIDSEKSLTDVAKEIGEMPLPPYIERSRETDPELRELDNERYQTVYAHPAKTVAAAAPTAGLHFTPEVLEKLKTQGIEQHDVTLHVGLSTFQPIKSDTIEEHTIHRELYEIPPTTQIALKKEDPGTRLAVGTTTLRSIEDFFKKTKDATNEPSHQKTFISEANIFIYPPAQFAGVDALITNFHLPRSTLVCLVSGFLSPHDQEGIAWLKELYALAIDKQYRFYSYGDAMLIL